MRRMTPFLFIFLMLAISSGVAGCNTVKGAGKDLQRGGQVIENAANRAGN